MSRGKADGKAAWAALVLGVASLICSIAACAPGRDADADKASAGKPGEFHSRKRKE